MTTYTPQAGILDFGTTRHTYLDLDLDTGVEPGAAVSALLAAVAAEVHTGTGGVAVAGIRPELWSKAGEDLPSGVSGFNEPITGPDGFTMPATQHDAVLWIQGAAQDAVFDLAKAILSRLTGIFTLASSTDGWVYRHDRDLTGFVDGTENPILAKAAEVIQNGDTGGSVLLLQRWPHDAVAWEALSVTEQEQVMGRTKADDVELAERPESAHVVRTDQGDFGHILRRNTAYGTVKEHGTMFVGIAAGRDRLHTMLESMAGIGGIRDALTRYSHAETGAYYYLPPEQRITAAVPEEDD